jgi:DNA polymerase-3 subunit delta'
VETLRAGLRSGALHHAYLFAGPTGVGKELAAVGLAQALLCPERPDVGCGTCSTCTRVAHLAHPDVTWLMPDEERVARGLAARSDFPGTPSREIRVEQVRGLQERLALRGLESRRKVAVVVPADAMNPSAQNALLKTLEEPAPDTTLVLVADSADRLLPTIRSRCSRVHFGPLAVDYIAQRLQEERKLDAASAALAAVMSGGSLGRALALDVKALARRRELIERFEALRMDAVEGLLRFAEEHGASREDAESALAILTVWNRDVAVARAGGPSLANPDLAALAREAAARTGEEALQRRHALIARAHGAISQRNGSPRLQLERMLIEMLEAPSP